MWEAIRIPPTAANADPMTNVIETTRFTFTPTNIAIFLSWAVARIALPIFVNLIKRVRSIVTTAVVVRITISADPIICAYGSMNSNSGMRLGKGRKSDVCANST